MHYAATCIGLPAPLTAPGHVTAIHAALRLSELSPRCPITPDRLAPSFAHLGRAAPLARRGHRFRGRLAPDCEHVCQVVVALRASTPTSFCALGAKSARGIAGGGIHMSLKPMHPTARSRSPACTRWFLCHCSDHGFLSGPSRRAGTLRVQRPFHTDVRSHLRTPLSTWTTQATYAPRVWPVHAVTGPGCAVLPAIFRPRSCW